MPEAEEGAVALREPAVSKFMLVPAVASPSFLFNCERLFTAPFRVLSPTGLLVSTECSLAVVAHPNPADFPSISIQN
jgi:hypothetical protein